MLYSIHLMGSTMLSVPELELDKEEAAKLSKAAQEVGKHYAVAINAKWVAIANLGAVAGFIYGPRFVAYRLRTKGAREAQAPKPAALPANSSPVPSMNGAATSAEKAPQPKIPIATATGKQMSPSEIFGSQEAEEFPGLG